MPPRFTALLLAAVALAAAGLSPAAAGAATIAQPATTTQLREYAGTLVFSRFDAATGEYRLAIRRPGAAPEDLPVAPADRTFDADIGPSANGGTQLVYVRCEETCDLFSYALGGDAAPSPAGERRIVRASDPERHDVAPTIWKGRLAWARIYGEQRDRKVVVYTRLLGGPNPSRTPPSTRLPGVPERRCGDFGPRGCGATTGHAVEELELWGANLAQTVTYECRSCSGVAQHELRLVDVADRTSSLVAFQVVGLGGQQLVGPSFHNGWLGWYKTCHGDPEGCGGTAHGPWRYGLRHRTYAKAPPGPRRVDGFVDLPQRQFRVEGCASPAEDGQNAGCRIEEVTPGFYAPARRPGR
jgi:hypothetical protein